MLDVTTKTLCLPVRELTDAMKQMKLTYAGKSSIPILSGARFLDGIVTTTDLDKRGTLTFDGQHSHEPFVVEVDAVLKALNGADAGKFVILTPQDEDTVLLEADGMIAKLKRYAVMDFPGPNRIEGDAFIFHMTEADLHRVLSFTAPCMSDEQTHYYLNGIYLHEQRGALTIVATDGHRMSVERTDIGLCDGEMSNVIIPDHTVKALLSALDEKAASEVKVRVFKNQVVFETARWSITSHVVDGTFPDYTRAVPQDYSQFVDIKPAEFMAAMKRLKKQIVRGRSCMKVDTANATLAVMGGEYSMALPMLASMGEFNFGVNIDYMMDATQALIDRGAKMLRVSNLGTGPMRVMQIDTDDYLRIVMPIHLNQAGF